MIARGPNDFIHQNHPLVRVVHHPHRAPTTRRGLTNGAHLRANGILRFHWTSGETPKKSDLRTTCAVADGFIAARYKPGAANAVAYVRNGW
jgi:hypothetical protein